MVLLRLIREPHGPERTFGVLFVDKYFQCLTMENTSKIVEAGEYTITLYNSPKNKRVVPLLMSVPNRSMIEIHPANFEIELEGCIAVGTDKTDSMLLNSQTAFGRLMTKMINGNYQIRIEES